MENPNELVDQVLDVTDVFFPNAYEACAFTSTTEPEEAARRLVSRVPTVVVTDGSNGVIWASSSGLSTISAVPVEAVDTTGAGDALAAGFVAAQLLGKPPSDALRVGIQAAAVLISSVGGHSAIGQLSPLK
jgi:ribokinase